MTTQTILGEIWGSHGDMHVVGWVLWCCRRQPFYVLVTERCLVNMSYKISNFRSICTSRVFCKWVFFTDLEGLTCWASLTNVQLVKSFMVGIITLHLMSPAPAALIIVLRAVQSGYQERYECLDLNVQWRDISWRTDAACSYRLMWRMVNWVHWFGREQGVAMVGTGDYHHLLLLLLLLPSVTERTLPILYHHFN